MLCALARQDTTAARAANFKMSQAQQDSPQTRYLMYKIALQDGDTELGENIVPKMLVLLLTNFSCEES
jgi:hypothetical protein